ncbi:hypothetical protein [Phormidesmis priestleyi]|uniref:hypothetical protein n=1 Tax=Phormidesmis priestleyi TaxID=268141 RepID=UPI00083AA65F|nr:hypothetical protein [Phormidesmis priestleyi]
MKQIRATIPTHLQAAFLEVGSQLNTTDPTVINTHILSCYFTGDRSDSPKETHSVQSADDFDDLADWTEEEI